MKYRVCNSKPQSEPVFAGKHDDSVDSSRRAFLQTMAASIGSMILPRALEGQNQVSAGRSGQKVVLVIFGGVRRSETFSPDGSRNIPHLAGDMFKKAIFYSQVRNEGVTAHFNATASILTGNWQRVDDWGKLAPTSPTLFEQFRKHLGAARSETWVIASNKALTNLIGASSVPGYGPAYGANVVFPKQLMVAAVVNALRQGRRGNLADRVKVEAEFESMLEGSNYEGLGWTVSDTSDRLDPQFRSTIDAAISNFVHSGGPTSGDELTFLVSREVMRKIAPRLMVVILSDVEVAHFGSYALHVAGIRTADRLAHQLWQEVEANPDYRGRSTMVILPEFGRDPDGSTTNGFFNHRSDSDSTRNNWMMALGAGVDRPQVLERPVRHVDLCPTLARMLGCPAADSQGQWLAELRF